MAEVDWKQVAIGAYNRLGSAEHSLLQLQQQVADLQLLISKERRLLESAMEYHAASNDAQSVQDVTPLTHYSVKVVRFNEDMYVAGVVVPFLKDLGPFDIDLLEMPQDVAEAFHLGATLEAVVRPDPDNKGCFFFEDWRTGNE